MRMSVVLGVITAVAITWALVAGVLLLTIWRLDVHDRSVLRRYEEPRHRAR